VKSNPSEKLIDRLNGTPATPTDLVAAYGQAHWNVLGPTSRRCMPSSSNSASTPTLWLNGP
jgi:hypothetical protein